MKFRRKAETVEVHRIGDGEAALKEAAEWVRSFGWLVQGIGMEPDTIYFKPVQDACEYWAASGEYLVRHPNNFIERLREVEFLDLYEPSACHADASPDPGDAAADVAGAPLGTFNWDSAANEYVVGTIGDVYSHALKDAANPLVVIVRFRLGEDKWLLRTVNEEYYSTEAGGFDVYCECPKKFDSKEEALAEFERWLKERKK